MKPKRYDQTKMLEALHNLGRMSRANGRPREGVVWSGKSLAAYQRGWDEKDAEMRTIARAKSAAAE
jgi:hypothetical protein